MMATTHAFAGLVLAAVVALAAPQLAAVVAAAAIAGGIFPDLDLYAGHRKTLHFPVYYWALALPATVVALVVPTDLSVGASIFLLAAAVHSSSDQLGGGLELKPWHATSEKAVYSHYHGRWLPPKRWVRYDGAPEDLALATALVLPVLLVFDGTVRTVVLAMLGVSAGYAVVRKPLASVGVWLVERVPDPVVAVVPERFLALLNDDHEHTGEA